MEQPVRTFSIGMADDPHYDESRFAWLAADAFGTEHTAFTLGAEKVELLDELLDAYDEPFGDSSALPTYLVSRLTRSAVTVALTGDGGDELFAGYHRLRAMSLAEALPGWAGRIGRYVSSRIPQSTRLRSPSRRVSRFFDAAGLPQEERMLRWVGFFSDDLDRLLQPPFRGMLTREDVTRSFRQPLEANRDLPPLARALALNFATYLQDDLLVKADRTSMAHGLELRSPFLDTALMEFAAALPDTHRVRGGTLKWVLREAFKDMLPKPILSRGKMGFGIPLPTWLRTHWRPLVERTILPDEAELWNLLRPEPVRELVERHMAGKFDNSQQIWALLTLEGWLRRGTRSWG
jgi:asparagine synthase (glutamine-hydrolysing)